MKPYGPRIICEDCGTTGPASVMVKLASAWLCRGCWHINENNDTQEAGK